MLMVYFVYLNCSVAVLWWSFICKSVNPRYLPLLVSIVYCYLLMHCTLHVSRMYWVNRSQLLDNEENKRRRMKIAYTGNKLICVERLSHLIKIVWPQFSLIAGLHTPTNSHSNLLTGAGLRTRTSLRWVYPVSCSVPGARVMYLNMLKVDTVWHSTSRCLCKIFCRDRSEPSLHQHRPLCQFISLYIKHDKRRGAVPQMIEYLV